MTGQADSQRRTAGGDQDVRQTTLGLNYYLRQNRMKLMVGYVNRHELEKPAANNIFQVQLQMFLH
ncbi:MAG: hypothetical protein JNN08_20795 [Bryobacterales bacterium]|nr:hypothetical protein [Bryobacterales bacterium]